MSSCPSDPTEKEKKNRWCSYCLVSSTSRKSYIGATINPDRRLRQHNGEIRGGAKITRGGRPWIRVCHFRGFPSERTALQFEWRWKNLSSFGSRRKKTCFSKSDIYLSHPSKGQHPSLLRRIQGVLNLLSLERYTRSAPPARSIPLTLVWEHADLGLRNQVKAALPPHVEFLFEPRP